MQKNLNQIIIGVVFVCSIGLLVYTTKKPAILPIENNTLIQDNNTPVSDNKDNNPVKTTNATTKTGTTSSTINTTTTTSTTTTPPTTTTKAGSITLAQITSHNSRTSCWSVINGNVYDLTSWIPNHPGGERTILSICGKDGTNNYDGQHGRSSKIAAILGGFKIGTLAN